MSVGRQQTFWFRGPKGNIHSEVFAHVNAVEHEQSQFHTANKRHARFYSNRVEPGLEGGQAEQARKGFIAVTENLVKSVIDTAVSLVGKSKPKISVLTDNGSWEMQQVARKLDKYLLESFRKMGVHEKMSSIFRDACIFGTGCMKVFELDGQIQCERVLINEIVVDESEVPSGGMPRQLHQIRPISKDKLKEMFPKHAADIERASETTSMRNFSEWRMVDPNMAMVVESWRLPAGPKDPGRHTITVDSATLLDEKWDKDKFPFVFYKWSPPITGFYGQGLAEDLEGFQVRQNELNDFARRAFDLISVPRVYVEHGTKLSKPQITNEIGAIIPFTGKPPTFFTPTALNNEFFTLHQVNRNSAFEFAGMSKMAAQATRPEGIEAGVALRELSDNQSQRLSSQQARFENRHIDVALQILELSTELFSGKKQKTEFEANTIGEAIPWSQIKEMKKSMNFNIQASSMLNDTPAGRRQTVIEFAQYGVPLRPDEIRRMLNHPDLELSDRRATSALEDVEWVIDELMDGRYPPPEPFQDLTLGIERVTAAYLDTRRAGAPEEVLEGFRQWITQAEDLLVTAQQEAAAAQAPQAAPAGGGSGGLSELGGDAFTETALPGLAVSGG